MWGRAERTIVLAEFDANLNMSTVCQISLGTPEHYTARKATEPAVCEAVLAGTVSGAPIDDVEPVPLSPEALSTESGASKYIRGGPENYLVGRGQLDVDNDGTPDDVGIVHMSEDSGAGCGHAYRASWPVKLNADGMPRTDASFNDEMRKIAGGDDEGRLFIFRGNTYYERKVRPASVDSVPTHIVWRLTQSEPVQACVFDAAAYGIDE